MSKARTLADFISDGSEFADGTISVAEVSGAAPLASPTFTGTVTVPTLTSTGNINLGDNDRVRFGAGNDLEIYHNEFNSYVSDNGTGSLNVTTNGAQIALYDTANSQQMVKAVTAGAVELYYDGALKQTTSTSGVDVTGKTTTDELDLNAIAATISDTAVDIFVYDTRKDSDGGAWRKRTQHTSWYNETLNTATRGSRKEFPAVAVIVAESKQLTIYDGDDPDLPMWMVFSDYAGTDNINQPMFRTGVKASYSGISALNGIIAVSFDWIGDYSGGLRYVRFTADDGYYLDQTTAAEDGKFNGNIEQRNDALGFSGDYGIIVNRDANDVAMTVLPNAPIDAATGLPVPTIAVATDGGISVIKDDGTVVDITTTYSSYDRVLGVNFRYDGRLVASFGYDANWNAIRYIQVVDIPSADRSIGDVTYNPTSDEFYATSTATGEDLAMSFGGSIRTQTDTAFGYDSGLIVLDPVPSAPTTGSQVAIASDYNTGWMNGDIKLATLSDTDDTNITGSELVTNGTFDSDASGWSIDNGSVTLSVSSGALVITTTSASYGYAYQGITGLTVGETYTFSFNKLSSNAATWVRLGTAFDDQTYYGYTPSNGITNVTFTATSSTLYITLVIGAGSSGLTCSFDDISVRKAELDRSVNGNGLQVFGTVTKSAVATGADLVAYSGFSSGNYLEQPYNSDLDFGTGDFCYMGWYKANSAINTNEALWSRGDTTSSFTGLFLVFINGSTDDIQVYAGANSITSTSRFADDVWGHLCIVRRNGVLSVYKNGTFAASSSQTSTMTNTSAVFRVGYNAYNNTQIATNLNTALLRASATAPSPEQIKKIYEDEKVLFQEGAQATLYGSSDAVTALAYDDSTELLHVGTSAGRSVFQGLRRVDNTTTAVTAAISASNNLVADE